MGMFDNVIPECPLPDEAAKLVREWQTKDFEWPGMDKYRITPEGRLMEEVYHVEDRSERALTGQGDEFAGCMSRVHEGWKDMNYHGVLNFYGSTSHDWHGEWVEYDAKFTDGQLVSIERVREQEPVTEIAMRAAPTGEKNG